MFREKFYDHKFGYNIFWIYPLLLMLPPFMIAYQFVNKIYIKIKYHKIHKEIREKYLGEK